MANTDDPTMVRKWVKRPQLLLLTEALRFSPSGPQINHVCVRVHFPRTQQCLSLNQHHQFFNQWLSVSLRQPFLIYTILTRVFLFQSYVTRAECFLMATH